MIEVVGMRRSKPMNLATRNRKKWAKENQGKSKRSSIRCHKKQQNLKKKEKYLIFQILIDVTITTRQFTTINSCK